MAKKQISFKQVGQNIILVIDEVTYTRKVADKTERDLIKEEVTSYNIKNNATALKGIIKTMQEGKEPKGSVKKAKSAKKVDVKPAAASIVLSKDTVQEVEKVKETEIKKEPVTAPSSYYGRREY